MPDFSAGTKEDWRSDADDFPEEALGLPLEDWDGEVWIDISNEVTLGPQVGEMSCIRLDGRLVVGKEAHEQKCAMLSITLNCSVSCRAVLSRYRSSFGLERILWESGSA